MHFVLVGEWNPRPLNELFTLGGRFSSPSKGVHMLKLAESLRSEDNTLGILASDFSMFFKVSQRGSF